MVDVPQETTAKVQTENGRASYMSKSRYEKIETAIESATQDPVVTSKIMESIREIMKFDPGQNTYKESRAKTMRDWRQRVREETGKSFYEASGRKEKRAAAAATNTESNVV